MIPRDRDEERQFYRMAYHEGLRDAQAGRPKANSALDWLGYHNGYQEGRLQRPPSADDLPASSRKSAKFP
jgi:hypothetical protein